MFNFFFFQAEDGIRDHCVTGVQTCALPISRALRAAVRRRIALRLESRVQDVWPIMPGSERSEERRVGKECRSRWSPVRLKKKPCGHRRLNRSNLPRFDREDLTQTYTFTPQS